MHDYVYMRPHFLAHFAKPAAPPDGQQPVRPAIDWSTPRTAERACCWVRPTMLAVIPPAPGRDHPTDVLLCGHHFRTSRSALAAAGAAVFELGSAPDGPPAPQQTAGLVARGKQ
jgi:hypothetical protein